MSDARATTTEPPTRSQVDTILEVRDADVSFSMERGTSNVLDDVSIDIERDEILGVVGESGSGKSMFASALLDAVVKPGQLDGEVTYYPESGGEPVDVLDLSEDQLKDFRWEEISMVFQGAMSSFNPTTTIETHFVETLRAHTTDVEGGLDHARDLLSDLYLEPERVFESYPHELSGGMKQRALVALALVLDPEVVVMDEPTAALDLLMQRSIIQLMQNLKRKYDLTLVFITHDLALVAELADRLAVMYAFNFVEQGPAEEIIERPSHPYTRALITSMPNLEASVEDMRPIEGSAPDPVNVPSGCSYHPRCPLADEHCETVDPHQYEVTESHHAACHYWEDAMDEISLDIESSPQTGETTASRDPAGVETDAETVVSLDDIEVHFSEGGSLLGLFDEPDTVRAVDGVSLDIAERDVVALVGESGCGKTTLGKTSVGLQRPTGGTVRFRGQDVWEAHDGGDTEVPFDDIRRGLQIIHQDPESALNPYQRVKNVLAEPLRRWYGDLDGEERLERIYKMLALVGMSPAEDYAERFPHQLSGGETQRIALMRAMLMSPDLVLADEAVSALDVSLRIEMMDLFLEMQHQFDTSYLFVSHDLSNARYLTEKAGGRIGIMYLGELVEIGTPERILDDPIHPYTKALRWASPDLSDGEGEMPLRTVDIPDPVDPPSGCRFHTRCPEAREVCTRENPTLDQPDDGRKAACFRANEDHEYWDSPSIAEGGELSGRADGGE